MKPTKGKIRDWVKGDTTQWFLGRVALKLNEVDTVRNVEEDGELLGRKKAIEIIEDVLADIIDIGELKSLQKKTAEEESLIKSLKDIPQEY